MLSFLFYGEEGSHVDLSLFFVVVVAVKIEKAPRFFFSLWKSAKHQAAYFKHGLVLSFRVEAFWNDSGEKKKERNNGATPVF